MFNVEFLIDGEWVCISEEETKHDAAGFARNEFEAWADGEGGYGDEPDQPAPVIRIVEV